MSTKKKVILFELNEVPWRVLKDYCATHPDSYLAQHIDKCYKYETVTPDHGELSPWITWPTLHRGVDNTKHHIHDFNQDLTEANSKFPSVWEILQNNGVSTGVCASMHSSPPPANFRKYAFYIPDPFATSKAAHPEYIESFQDFNLQMSRESSRNVSSGLNLKAGTRVILNSPRLGLRPSTFVELGMQVLNERKKPWIKTRRRTYQMVLAFDVFMKQLKSSKPQFATFFTNHVASAMHRYWAAAYPGDYTNFNIEKDWVNTYKDEIHFTMGIFNRFFKQVVEFVNKNPEYKLIVASSMGQASTTAEQIDSQVYVEKPEQFLSAMGLTPNDWTAVPSMFPQFNVTVNKNKIADFKGNLDKVQILGKHIEYREQENGFFAVDLGQKNVGNGKALFNGKEVELKEIGLYNLIIEDKADSTAYHIPEGICLVYDPENPAKSNEIKRISSIALTPNILKNFDVKVPDYMDYVPMEGIS